MGEIEEPSGGSLPSISQLTLTKYKVDHVSPTSDSAFGISQIESLQAKVPSEDTPMRLPPLLKFVETEFTILNPGLKASTKTAFQNSPDSPSENISIKTTCQISPNVEPSIKSKVQDAIDENMSYNTKETFTSKNQPLVLATVSDDEDIDDDNVDALLHDLHEFLVNLDGGLAKAQLLRRRVRNVSRKSRNAVFVTSCSMTVWERFFSSRGAAFAKCFINMIDRQGIPIHTLRMADIACAFIAILAFFGILPRHYSYAGIVLGLHIIILFGLLYWHVVYHILVSFRGLFYLAQVAVIFGSGTRLLNFDARVATWFVLCLILSWLPFLDAVPPTVRARWRRLLLVRLCFSAIMPLISIAIFLCFRFGVVPDIVDAEVTVGKFRITLLTWFSTSFANMMAFQLNFAAHLSCDSFDTACFFALPTEIKYLVYCADGSKISTRLVAAHKKALGSVWLGNRTSCSSSLTSSGQSGLIDCTLGRASYFSDSAFLRT